MAVFAGQSAIAGKMPGERIATDIDVSDSATFTTTETTVQSVTADLVSGRIYGIHFYGHANSSVGTDHVVFRIREDNSTGTELQSDVVGVDGSTTLGTKSELYAEYTAVATGSKTFVVAGIRTAASTGNCFLEAGSNRPSYLYVDYIRG